MIFFKRIKNIPFIDFCKNYFQDNKTKEDFLESFKKELHDEFIKQLEFGCANDFKIKFETISYSMDEYNAVLKKFRNASGFFNLPYSNVPKMNLVEFNKFYNTIRPFNLIIVAEERK